MIANWIYEMNSWTMMFTIRIFVFDSMNPIEDGMSLENNLTSLNPEEIHPK